MRLPVIFLLAFLNYETPSNIMEVGKVPRKQKTPEKQGFIDSKEVSLPTSHYPGIAVEQEL